ncbi:WecB/TagA/CpsF family glycosyltransferase [Shewanella sp. KCT]|uniref:WecB/TagA/CpsF family glycosyltransferase n=1 Tax=Shewanella sp. KCT TaxID=2569535 RepID=UPI001183BE84|nr:WecB/TagA/CpsF family glycosyltransferase [Shewanella sp. KCT]TVP10600.1 N-acetylglucosaminyldiphospho-UDP N-acetyl-beta-D-mannosaminyltransferase [Shewanella sp. KCT]
MTDVTRLFGFEIIRKPVNQVVREAIAQVNISVVNTINPHSYIESKGDQEFRNALFESDVLIPDGSGIILASKLVNKVDLKKIAGADLFSETMSQLNEKSGSVFFLGSSDKVLNIMAERASTDYPNVIVNFLSPPYKDSFSDADLTCFIESINKCSPDVLFVGLTAPKQEKLIHRIKSKVDVRMVSGIGAVFDFYAGTVVRPHPIWIKLHLEWLVRLIGEPKRLWRRNFVSTPLFILEILLVKFGVKSFD